MPLCYKLSFKAYGKYHRLFFSSKNMFAFIFRVFDDQREYLHNTYLDRFCIKDEKQNQGGTLFGDFHVW